MISKTFFWIQITFKLEQIIKNKIIFTVKMIITIFHVKYLILKVVNIKSTLKFQYKPAGIMYIKTSNKSLWFKQWFVQKVFSTF